MHNNNINLYYSCERAQLSLDNNESILKSVLNAELHPGKAQLVTLVKSLDTLILRIKPPKSRYYA